jgi:hypothetical protein
MVKSLLVIDILFFFELQTYTSALSTTTNTTVFVCNSSTTACLLLLFTLLITVSRTSCLQTLACAVCQTKKKLVTNSLSFTSKRTFLYPYCAPQRSRLLLVAWSFFVLPFLHHYWITNVLLQTLDPCTRVYFLKLSISDHLVTPLLGTYFAQTSCLNYFTRFLLSRWLSTESGEIKSTFESAQTTQHKTRRSSYLDWIL